MKTASKHYLPVTGTLPNIRQAPERGSSKVSKAMTVEEVRTLLHAIDEMQDYDFGNYIRALLYTGARRNEILMLRWEDIDWGNKKMRIYQEKTKKELEIPIILNTGTDDGFSSRRKPHL